MIYTEVKIDMENSNALITIAYISQSEGNPYKVFCEYIKYCITMHYSNQMLLGDLRRALSTEFGIYFPRNVLARCIRTCLKSSEQKGNKGKHGHFKGSVQFSLAIFPKAATFFKPTKCTLNNPTFGQNFELVKFISFYHLN